MLLEHILSAPLFEALMLICFGVSWPVAIYKTLRTKRTEGKSLLFLLLILLGYVAGMASKFILAAQTNTRPNWVILLYAANAIMVALDIFLYQRYRPRRAKPDLGEPTLP